MTDERYKFQRPTILRFKENIVGKCDDCSGVGSLINNGSLVRECGCMAKYRWKRSLLVSNISKEFWRCRTWKIINNVEYWNKHIIPYSLHLDEALSHGRGFFFYGENGLGKTTAAMFILISALEKRFNVHYIPLRQLMSFLRKASREDETSELLVDEISCVDFLVIDEMGKVNNTDFVVGEVESLIRERIGKLLPTILITNLGLKSFEDTYGQSTMSLLSGSTLQLEFKGEDFRKSVKREKIEKFDWSS